MDTEFLTSKEGESLLEKHKHLSSKELDQLLLKKSDARLRDVATLLKLRRKASQKFKKAKEMYFTSKGLEQSTQEELADYIASEMLKIIPENSLVLEVGCGIGGNSLSLAKHFKVLAVESDPDHIKFAKKNAEIYKVKENITFINSRIEDLPLKKVDAFFFDPQRERPGKTKTRSIFNSTPPVEKIAPLLLEKIPDGCIKISPAFDDQEIKKLPEHPGLEVVSKKNNNKLALLWLGRLNRFHRKATCFSEIGKKSLISKKEKEAPVTSIQNYLYKPNKAVIKASLIDELAKKYNIKRISSKASLLTSEKVIKENDLLRVFEVIYHSDSLRKLKRKLKEEGVGESQIMTENFFIKPEELRKKLKVKDGEKYCIIATIDKKNRYILAKPLKF